MSKKEKRGLSKAQTDIVDSLVNNPVGYAHLLGFDKLTGIHNDWMRDMILSPTDKTLQAHRGAYKTTCVAVVLAVQIVLFPNLRTMFNRKTDTDVQEVIGQVGKILQHPVTGYFINQLYKTNLVLTVERVNEISTNLGSYDPRGASQLYGMGIKGSLTGKHFDRIYTDDIINLQDRISKAEREKTKAFYQELQNVKNRGGRIYNTGTPWHKDDCFTLMPEPRIYDCYSTGLIDVATIEEIKGKMTSSLFAANYELRHIASDDVMFTNPQTGAEPVLVEQGNAHIDASYGGEDYTAFTIIRKTGDKWYVFGKLWHKHVDECLPEVNFYYLKFLAKQIDSETNADKGYLKKELRKLGMKANGYHENMNKFVKIASYLKAEWNNVVFVEGTDAEYIQQILDYTIDASHDDAPDSLASLIRKMWGKKEQPTDTSYLLYL